MTHRLTIRRLRNHYLAPKDHPSPEDLRSRLDQMARQRLAGVCGAALDRVLDPRDPSIWFIRRLRFDLSLDAGAAAPDEIARFWGEQIAALVVRLIAAGNQGEHAIRFAGHDDYVARFAVECAAGTAFDRWYFRAFESLRSLPAGTAIREALVREPQCARPVLQRIAAVGGLDSVLRVLSESDTRAVLRICEGPEPAADPEDELEALLAIWPAASGKTDAREILRLAVRTQFRASPATIAAMFALASFLAAAPTEVRAAVARGELPGVPAAVPGLHPPLRAVLQTRAALAARVVEAIAPATALAPNPDRIFDSPFGSVFLLLPAMLAAAPPEILESAGLRLLLALECLGAPRSQETLRDPALVLAAGIGEIPALPASGVPAEVVQAVMREFASHLLGFRESTPEFVRANFLTGRSVVRVGDERIDVELPPCPLRLILRLAGVHGRTYGAPWLGSRVVRLRLPEE